MASTSFVTEPPNAVLFKEWFASHGGSFHSGVRYASVSSGLSIIASEDIQPDATIVTCPFSIIITPSLSKAALQPILKDASIFECWTERQTIIIYICFHWIASQKIYDTLIHSPYLDTLPSPDKLRTPLHFTDDELDALKGTNLYGATVDRRRDWEAEWERCHADVSGVNEEWGRALTWERFLTAATYLSSRAFPSTLLSPSPTLVQQPDSYPVLIPGIDALNHARAHPVSWVVTFPPTVTSTSSSPSTVDASQAGISLVTHNASKAGAEIFNNYGAKPNSELLLGYGFTLPANPDDTIVLKIGGLGGISGTTAQQNEVARGARGATAMWDIIMEAVKKAQGNEEGEDEEEGEVPEWQLVLDCADMLRSMTESLLARLPSEVVPGSEGPGALRGDVVPMIGHYVSGQREVLQDLLHYANDREMGGVALARRGGVVIQTEGGGEDDEDEGGQDDVSRCDRY